MIVSKKLIQNFKNESLFSRIKKECESGDIFLSPRQGERITIYYKGGRFLQYDKDGFSITEKYFSLNKTIKDNDNKITVDKIVNFNFTKKYFEEYYEGIKEKCALYNKNSEAHGVSCFYKYNYLTNNDIVLLDIEYSNETVSGEKSDRIDIVLYNKKSQTLQLIEAKKFNNPELHNHSIIKQVSRYNKQIAANKNIILDYYQKFVETINYIFDINLPKPENINNNVSVYFFDFDSDDKKSKKYKHIINNLKKHYVNYYVRGHAENIEYKNLQKFF